MCCLIPLPWMKNWIKAKIRVNQLTAAYNWPLNLKKIYRKLWLEDSKRPLFFLLEEVAKGCLIAIGKHLISNQIHLLPSSTFFLFLFSFSLFLYAWSNILFRYFSGILQMNSMSTQHLFFTNDILLSMFMVWVLSWNSHLILS